MGSGQQMPMMNQMMPVNFPPMDPNAMYAMAMGMANQGKTFLYLFFYY